MSRGALARLAFIAAVIAAALLLSLRHRRDVGPRGVVAAAASQPTTIAAYASMARPLAASVPTGGSLSGAVLAPNGAPIAGALVCADGSSPAIPDDEIHDPYCVTADVAGHWTIGNLPAATYTIDATAPRWLPARYVDADGNTTIGVGVDDARANVDLTLAPGGAEVRGRVVDLQGDGIANAIVTVSARGMGQSSGEARVVADAAGGFVAWVAPGRFDAHGESDGFVAEWADGVAPASHVEIVLPPAARLVGRVVAADTGAPVAGATVGAESLNEDGWNPDAESTRTDADGRFALERLPAGRWLASAELLGAIGEASESVRLRAGETSAEVTIALRPGHTVAGRVVVASDDPSVAAAPCVDGSVSLFEPRRARRFSASLDLHGAVAMTVPFAGQYEVSVHCSEAIESASPITLDVVTDATDNTWTVRRGRAIRGVVVDREGHPMPRVQVEARGVERHLRSATYGSDTTGTDGRFAIVGLEAGRYALDASSDDAKPPPPQDVDVTATGAAPEARIVLDRGGAIAGDVVDETGASVAGVDVSVIVFPGGERGTMKSVTTDEAGHFSIGGIDDGPHSLSVTGDGSTLHGPGGVSGSPTSVDVHAGAVATARLTIEALRGELRGNVVDAAGKPVVGVAIEVSRELPNEGLERCAHLPARTDASGQFVVRRLPNATFTVRARLVDGTGATATHVPAGSTPTLTVSNGGAVHGTVADASGLAPDAISVRLTSTASLGPFAARFTNTAGEWTLRGIAPGDYTLEIVTADGESMSPVTVKDGETTTVVTTLDPIASLSGCVVWGDDGTPAADLDVNAEARGPRTSATRSTTATTDAKGCFRLARAPVGKVTVSVDDGRSGDPLGRQGMTLVAGANAVGVVRALRPRELVDVGDLGMTTRTSGADSTSGWHVLTVAPGGAAEAAGLHVDDEITAIDGVDVTGEATALYTTATIVPPGARVRVTLAGGRTLTVVAGAAPAEPTDGREQGTDSDGDDPDETP